MLYTITVLFNSPKGTWLHKLVIEPKTDLSEQHRKEALHYSGTFKG